MTRQSLSDEQMIDALRKGREQLLSGTSEQSLLSVLRRRLRSITRDIYILRWTPEQSEDLYDVLIDGKTVIHVEIARGASQREVVFQTWPVEEYLKGQKTLVKPERRKLELALRLASGRV
jgi:hypothetical protein